jgi:hypothetical protein
LLEACPLNHNEQRVRSGLSKLTFGTVTRERRSHFGEVETNYIVACDESQYQERGHWLGVSLVLQLRGYDGSAGRLPIKTINLKLDMPVVREALQRMERELSVARNENLSVLKFVHGYGSKGVGGEICVAVQRRLVELAASGQIRGCIFGDNWSKSDETTWKILQAHPRLKNDSDLGRRNRGITIVWL